MLLSQPLLLLKKAGNKTNGLCSYTYCTNKKLLLCSPAFN